MLTTSQSADKFQLICCSASACYYPAEAPWPVRLLASGPHDGAYWIHLTTTSALHGDIQGRARSHLGTAWRHIRQSAQPPQHCMETYTAERATTAALHVDIRQSSQPPQHCMETYTAERATTSARHVDILVGRVATSTLTAWRHIQHSNVCSALGLEK